MESESACSVLVSGKDNQEIKNISGSEILGNIGESEVQNNGFCEVENNDNNGLTSDVNGKGIEVSGPVSSPPVGMKSEVSPSSTMTRKGYGLKKWRRIKRDIVSQGGDSSVDTGKMVMQESSNPAGNPSKRTQVFADRPQKSEGSVSSTNPVVGNLDVFALLGDSGLAMGPSVDAGTDSENSEDRSSKSSTAASISKIKYELPAILGFPQDKGRINSLSGKNLNHSVQRGHQQGKGRSETIKKAREERIKIEKENSHSSIESDSRSSNFVFMQGTFATSNGIRSEGPVHDDGENGDEVQGSEQQVGDGLRGGYYTDGKGGYGDIPPEDVIGESSSEVKKERSENNGSSSDQDPLVESIFVLQSAQEALQKEVLKFKEISKDASVDDSDSIHPEFTDVEQNHQETSSEKFQSGEGVVRSSRAVQSEGVEMANRDVETELEDLFKKRIEAEVLYLAISRTVQKLKVAAVAQSTILEEQKASSLGQAQMLNKLGDTENKAAMLKKGDEKLENFHESIASADEILKLQKRVYKYAWYLFVQLLALFVILGVFIFRISPNYVEVVPT